MPSREQVQRWLDDYVAAWRSYDEDAIRALFAPDATHAYAPYEEPLRGADAIAASWLGDRDEPGSWEAAYAPALIEDDAAIATGETRYADGRVFSNLFELESTPMAAAPASSSGSWNSLASDYAASDSSHRTHFRTALSDTPYFRPTADQLVSAISRMSWS